MAKFKVGDRVRCINVGNSRLLRQNQVYIVHSYTNESYKILSLEGVYLQTGGMGTYTDDRFELVEPVKKKKIKKTKDRKEFEKEVIAKTMAHSSGCYEGKVAFLESLGLEPPAPRTFKFTVEYTEQRPAQMGDLDDVKRRMQSSLGGSWTDLKIEVEEVKNV